MKKLYSTILAILLILMQTSTAFAIPNTDPLALDSVCYEANNVVNAALQQHIVPDQDQITALYLANSIPLYEVNSNNEVVEVDTIEYYPVLDQNGIARGMIVARLQDANSSAILEYNTMFCSELNMLMQNSSSICFIFDQTNIYIFDGTEYFSVLQDSIPDMSRGILNSANMESVQLRRSSIVAVEQCDLASTCDPSITGQLYVPLINQDNWKKGGCWAACAVSVGNYVSSGNLTIDDVMQKYADGKDEPKLISTIQTVLDKEYGIKTYYKGGAVKLSTVIEQIKAGTNQGDPIIARVAYMWLLDGHFIVIRGFTYNPGFETNYVTIMDSLSHAYRTLSTIRSGDDSLIQYTTPTGSTVYSIDMYLLLN